MMQWFDTTIVALTLVLLPLALTLYHGLILYRAYQEVRGAIRIGEPHQRRFLLDLLDSIDRALRRNDRLEAKRIVSQLCDFPKLPITPATHYLVLYSRELLNNVFWSGIGRAIPSQRRELSASHLDCMREILKRSKKALKTQNRLDFYEAVCNLTIFPRLLQDDRTLVEVDRKPLYLTPIDLEFVDDLENLAFIMRHKPDVEFTHVLPYLRSKWCEDKARLEALSDEVYFVLTRARPMLYCRNLRTIYLNASTAIKVGVAQALLRIAYGLRTGKRSLVLDALQEYERLKFELLGQSGEKHKLSLAA